MSPTTISVSVEVIRASSEQEPVLANLLELYVYDFSEFMNLKLDANGRFGYKPLPLYWKEPERHPFLIGVNGHWAGFAFVRQGSQISGDVKTWDMAEFFILRGYRRLGIGRKAAHEVWRQFPGRWEVRVMNRNQKAKAFWQHAIDEFTGKAIEPTTFDKDGKGWHVFSFESNESNPAA